MDKAGIALNESEIEVSTKGKSLPAVIELTPQFCEFLGLWVAEGSYSGDSGIRVSINSKELPEILPNIESLFGKPTIYYKKGTNGADIYISNKALRIFMEKVLGIRHGAAEKHAPEIIFSLDKRLIASFLRGYYSGDGSIAKNQRGVITVEGSTESKGLADDLMHLLLYFGIVAKDYPRKGRSQHRVCFTGVSNLRNFAQIGFLGRSKNSQIKHYIGAMKWERSDQIPITRELREHLSFISNANNWQNSATIGRGVLAGFEEELPSEMAYLAGSDIYWDRVEEIREVENEEYVYDISVEPNENFVAGFGGIFAHNSEQNLRKIFKEAEKSAPSIIFIDEIDSIAPKREEVTGEVERRIVSQLLTLMDGLQARGKVIVIAATNRQNAIDPALRRPGRFDREIEIGVPDTTGRLDILQIHTRNMPLVKDVDLKELASLTYGFVGADLEMLAKEAAMASLRRTLPKLGWKKMEEFPPETLEKLRVTKADFEQARKLVEPSAMREVMIEVPNVKWSDIGGLAGVKKMLQEIVEWPLKNPESFKRLGIKPPSGVLLYGLPGSGKTLLAKAVATESGSNFISIRGPEITSKWVGESEKRIRDIFRRARQVAPAVIFFDEIDAIAPKRGLDMGSRAYENIVSQILVEMSGIEKMASVIVLAATNRPDIIDPALLRPGRFERQVLVPAPDEKARLEILRIYTKDMPLKGVNLSELAKKTANFTGADVEALVREAGMDALRKNMNAKVIAKENFDHALKTIKPSVSKELIEFYSKVDEELRSPVRKRKKADKEEEDMRYVG